ncbi:MAG TPA: hypothetical protein VJV79_19895 [Polyangiaceae bacterium]|nr:hypothetical protein [Polyangiaceae bacterium]
MIEEARGEMRPPAGERERLGALLDAQLYASIPSPVDQVPLAARHASGWRLVTSLTVGAALVGGAALWALGPQASQNSASPSVSAPATVEPSAPAPATAAPAPEAQAQLPSEPARPVKPPAEPQAPAQHSQDRLAQEVALLSRATSDLRAGRAGAALKSLDEHQRKFPSGMLTVERRAVRAQALCTLKRVSEGRAELARLAPQSPAAGRAKQLCDAAESGSEK